MKTLLAGLLVLAAPLGCGGTGGAGSDPDAATAATDASTASDATDSSDASDADLPSDATMPGDASTSSTGARLAVGGYHSCLLDAAGQLRCWGYNQNGQLGDGTNVTRPLPVVVPGGPFLAASAGNYHTCAITVAHRALCWGLNGDGQLGTDSTTNRYSPAAVANLDVDVVAISAGGATTCAVVADGSVYCWGNNQYGQIGDGTTERRLTPARVTGLANATSVSASSAHVCATSGAGTVVCWGWEYHGRLGNGAGSVNGYQMTPVEVSLVAPATQIATGGDFGCARLTTGRIACWGGNDYGQLGTGSQVYSSVPVLVASVTGLDRIATADAATCALGIDDVVRCWGRNRSGQIGNGIAGVGAVVLSPSVVMGLSGPLSDVDSGFAHTCALAEGGAVSCWGSNTFGEIGDGTVNTDRFTATPVQL